MSSFKPAVDIARAMENRVSVIRADVAGRTADLVSYGSSGIVDPGGTVRQSARRLAEDLLVADLDEHVFDANAPTAADRLTVKSRER
jgi:predicted amidohydrolase